MRSPVSTISSARWTASSSFFINAPEPGLYVEHERVGALGQFFAHDRSADQIWALDRASHIAQRVKFAIGGRDLLRLADHAPSAGLQDAMKFGDRKTHAKSGNRFELIERAPGVAQVRDR